MALRQPTDKELSFINSTIAKKKLSANDVYILDSKPANTVMLTCYSYFIGASSLFNFKGDLESGKIPIHVMHMRDVPLGRVLPGEISKMGEGYELSAPFYMPKDFSNGRYKTDDLAKAYETGTLDQVSIRWGKGDGAKDNVQLVCGICGNDIRDYNKCEHIPGKEYDGKLCTFTVENAHLKEISLVDKGGLPGATLSGISYEEPEGKGTIGFENMADIKRLSMNSDLCFTLSMPINGGEINKATSGGYNMKFEDFLKQFANDLAALFVKKEDHEKVVTDLKGKETTLSTLTTDHEKLKKDHETLTGEHTELTKKFANVNAELETDKELKAIGTATLEGLSAEYHRLGVALHGEKWDKGAKDTLLNALSITEREKSLKVEIETMKDAISKSLEKRTESEAQTGAQSHMDNPNLYKIG